MKANTYLDVIHKINRFHKDNDPKIIETQRGKHPNVK